MAAIMTCGSRSGKGNVQAGRAGDGDGNLADLNGMGKPGPEMVVFWGDIDLAFACQTAKCPGVVDAVQVSLETSAKRVWLLLKHPLTSATCPCCMSSQDAIFAFFAFLPFGKGAARPVDRNGLMSNGEAVQGSRFGIHRQQHYGRAVTSQRIEPPPALPQRGEVGDQDRANG